MISFETPKNFAMKMTSTPIVVLPRLQNHVCASVVFCFVVQVHEFFRLFILLRPSLTLFWLFY